jgi:Cu2+-exporting ATPase
MILGYTIPDIPGVRWVMSLSTVVVAVNAQLLRRLDLRPEASVRAVLGEAAVPIERRDRSDGRGSREVTTRNFVSAK